ncbi:MAG: hypothetical protein GXO64_04315 [Candidatus Micrarchaeota archaeon]|nr:hypothetical protein [Candidatus Micrarchaeota archaeon]
MIRGLSKTLKKAYKKGAISKKDYEKALEKLKKERTLGRLKKKGAIKSEYSRKRNEIVLGEIKIVKDGGRARVVFDTGEEQIPLNFGPESVDLPADMFYDIIKIWNYLPVFSRGTPHVQELPTQRGIVRPLGVRPLQQDTQQDALIQNEFYNQAEPRRTNEEYMDMPEIRESEGENIYDSVGAENNKTDNNRREIEKKDDVVPAAEVKHGDSEKGAQNPEMQNLQQQRADARYEEQIPEKKEDNTPHEKIDIRANQENTQQHAETLKTDVERPFHQFADQVSLVRTKSEDGKKETGTDKLTLIDMKKEIPVKQKKKDRKRKQKDAKQKKFGIVHEVSDIFKRTKKETRDEKLERLAKENLEKIKGIQNNREAIIKAAHVLKDFLEIKMGIPYSTTYREIIEITKKKKDIHEDIKKEIIGFFNRMEECEYARGFEGEYFSDYYKSALRIIEEMSD